MTMYAIRPAPDTSSLDDAEVVDEFPHGVQHLMQAVALWRLVGSDHAAEIEGICERAERRNPNEPCFLAEDLRQLVRLLAGVVDAIVVARLVDEHWRVQPDQLAALAEQVPGMDLSSTRSLEDKTHALAEVMSNAIAIKNALQVALDAVCVVVIS